MVFIMHFTLRRIIYPSFATMSLIVGHSSWIGKSPNPPQVRSLTSPLKRRIDSAYKVDGHIARQLAAGSMAGMFTIDQLFLASILLFKSSL